MDRSLNSGSKGHGFQTTLRPSLKLVKGWSSRRRSSSRRWRRRSKGRTRISRWAVSSGQNKVSNGQNNVSNGQNKVVVVNIYCQKIRLRQEMQGDVDFWEKK